MFPFCRTSPCALLTASALFSPAGLHAQGYTVSNLVADLPGAANIDTNLVNVWGLAILPKDMLIVNANENAIAGLYGTDGKPTGNYLAVNPAPSGLAVDRGGGFKVTDGQMMRPSTLIFNSSANRARIFRNKKRRRLLAPFYKCPCRSINHFDGEASLRRPNQAR